MYVLVYIQLYETTKEGGQAHAGKNGVVAKDSDRASPQVEDAGGRRRDHDVGDRRKAHLGVFEEEGGEVMPLEKTQTKGIYKSPGKKGKVTYVVMYYIQVEDLLSEKGWKWKPKGKRFSKYQDALNFKVKIQNEVKGGNHVEPSDITIEQVAREWLESGKPDWKKQTILGHEMQVRKY